MENLEKVVVTDVVEVMNVFNPKGRYLNMNNRKYYGLSFCEEGQIKYTHNGNEFISDNKHAIILPQGQNYNLKGEKTGNFYLINFTCREELTDTFILFPIQNINSFVNDFELIKELLLFPENRMKIMSIFYQMIHRLFSCSRPCNTIMPAIKYIEKNYNKPNLTNEILAKECNISEIYLRNLFNKHLMTTPKQYISEIRLQKAKQLLSEGTLKINAISEKCGFSSTQHFWRFFKHKTGTAPTEYSKQNVIRKI